MMRNKFLKSGIVVSAVVLLLGLAVSELRAQPRLGCNDYLNLDLRQVAGNIFNVYTYSMSPFPASRSQYPGGFPQFAAQCSFRGSPPEPAPFPIVAISFYEGSWVAFLNAIHPTRVLPPHAGPTQLVPTLESWCTADIVFQTLFNGGPDKDSCYSGMAHPFFPIPELRAQKTDDLEVGEAGKPAGVLIDDNGNPLFYYIRVNSTYARFVIEGSFYTGTVPQNATVNDWYDILYQTGKSAKFVDFPPGSVELKLSYRIVTGATAASKTTPSDFDQY